MFLVRRWDSDVLRHIRDCDPHAMSKEAEELYERAIKEYGDVIWWKDPNRPGRQETMKTGDTPMRWFKGRG